MLENKTNLKQKIVIVCMDVLLLAELCLSIYLGYHDKENITLIFLRTFVPLCLATVVCARILIRRFSDLRGQEVALSEKKG
ncbi:MAG: hypothetical protein PHV85_08690 [Desulfovibrionaceae bacterium]|nr:hypothetical protein [Desulfovibrionaceae bacterium]MDD4952612.1 hypothetical protein [Desulfovibrionaceae bacterium]